MAGIYHNATLGVISLSKNGESWTTIADKNLGATTVYNYGDTLTIQNTGNVFQWGNNYKFPGTLDTSTSISTTSTTKNASSYGPGNYYRSNVWVTDSVWENSGNENLWGGTTGTVEAKQGPCDTGFHVPTATEWSIIITMFWNTAWSSSNYVPFLTYLKIPLAGVRISSSSIYEVGSKLVLMTSTRDGNSMLFPGISSGVLSSMSSTSISNFNSQIRPFKNEAVIPYADEGWTKLYGDDLPPRPEPPLPKLKRLQKGGNYYYFKDAPTHASAISLNKSSITLTEAGQTEQLVATVTPSDAVDKSIIWTSSNENVARVSSNGLVSCITPGDCTITATTNDGGYTATCSVTMIHVTGVSLNVSTLSLNTAGETSQLTATITPSNASNKNVTWTSSNTSIATVSSTGLVTCVTPGSATITVTTEDGGYTASCSVINKRTIQFTVVGGGGGGAGSSNQVGGSGGGGGGIKGSSRDILGDCIMVTVGAGGTKGNCKSSGGDGGNSGITEYSQGTVLYNITGFGGKGGKYNNDLCAWLNYGGDAGGWCISSGGSSTGCLGGNGGAIQKGGGGGGGGASSNGCWQTIDSYFPGAGGCGIGGCGGGGGGGGGCHRTGSLSPDHCDGACGCSGGGNGGGRGALGGNATTCGSGGGGAGAGSLAGGAGAGGVVTICYKTDGSCGITCATGGTKSTSGAYTIHTFTSSGRFCIIS